jgi:hypothetical protein
MNQHLSSQQILEWMNGENSPGAKLHVGECAECAAQVERLAGSLQMFRDAVREVADRSGEGQTVLRMPRRRMALRWITAAAALVMLAGVPIFKVQEDRHRAAELARQDAELLDEVNAELSSGVAEPMKPLQKMVIWGSETTKRAETREF